MLINESLKAAYTQTETFYTNIEVIADYIIEGILSHKNSPFKISDQYLDELRTFLNNFNDQFCTSSKKPDPTLKLEVDWVRVMKCLKAQVQAYNRRDGNEDDWDPEESLDEYLDDISTEYFTKLCEGKVYTLDELVSGLLSGKDECLNALKDMLNYLSESKEAIGARGEGDEGQGNHVVRRDQKTSKFLALEGINNLMSLTLGNYVKDGKYKTIHDAEKDENTRLLNVAACGLAIANVAALEYAKRTLPGVKGGQQTSDVGPFVASLKATLAPKTTNVDKSISRTDDFKSESLFERSMKYTAFGECMNGAKDMVGGYSNILRTHNSDEYPCNVELNRFSSYESELSDQLKEMNNPFSKLHIVKKKGYSSRKQRGDQQLEQSKEQEVAHILLSQQKRKQNNLPLNPKHHGKTLKTSDDVLDRKQGKRKKKSSKRDETVMKEKVQDEPQEQGQEQLDHSNDSLLKAKAHSETLKRRGDQFDGKKNKRTKTSSERQEEVDVEGEELLQEQKHVSLELEESSCDMDTFISKLDGKEAHHPGKEARHGDSGDSEDSESSDDSDDEGVQEIDGELEFESSFSEHDSHEETGQV